MRLAGTDRGPDLHWVLSALEQHEAALLRYSATLVGSSRAQDVVQDAFMKLCAQSFESVQGHVAAWLFTVCRNRALELRRAERRLSPLDDDDVIESADSSPGVKVERAQDMSRVGRAMAALSSRQRELLRLKVEGGLSYKEIAEVMGLSVSNVGFILHGAIADLRERLDQPEGELREGRAL